MTTYSFDSDNNLMPCIIYKADLAEIYGVTLRQLRRELQYHITSSRKHKYSTDEVKKIFRILGTPTRWDVERVTKRSK